MRHWPWAVAVLAVAGLAAWILLGGREPRLHPRAASEGRSAVSPAAEPSRPAASAAQVEAYVAEIVPHLERVAGRKFKAVPPVVLDDAEAVLEILAADLEPAVRQLQPQWTEPQVRDGALAQARQGLRDVLGKYGIRARRLGLLTSHLPASLAAHGIDPSHAAGILRVLIAHELTHALQAESIDVLGLVARAPGEDAITACTATIEGHAMFVQDQVARALDLTEASEEYAKVFSIGPARQADPQTRSVAIYQEFVYLGGRRFIEHHQREGGIERVWQVLEHPPVLSSMIQRPATYTATPPRRPDLRKAFASIRADLAKTFTSREQELGEAQLRCVFPDMTPEAIDALTRNVLLGRRLTLTSIEDHRGADLYLLALREPKQAAEMAALLLDGLAAEVKTAGRKGAIRFEDASDPWSGLQAERLERLALSVADEDGQPVFDHQVLLVARKGWVLQARIDSDLFADRKLVSWIDAMLSAAADAPAIGEPPAGPSR